MFEIRERFDFQAALERARKVLSNPNAVVECVESASTGRRLPMSRNQSASSALEYTERIAALRSAVGGMLHTGIANGDC
jgi:hypothetical protein